MKKPDLGKDLSGIDTIKVCLKDVAGDYSDSYYGDILEYVLWILDDYKRLKAKENKCGT